MPSLARLIPLLCSVLACTGDEQLGASPDLTTTDLSTGPATPTEPTSTTSDLPAPSTSDPSDPPDPGDSGDPSETSSSTTDALAGCGDGVLDPDEQCDDGFAANTIDAACLPTCTLNVCGDGFVLDGVEQCDLGPLNSHQFGGCVPVTCHWGPNCGDGVVSPGHELCDPGAPLDPFDDVVPCTPACRFDGKVVFLSSTLHDGDMAGVDGADLECQLLAAAFDPGNHHAYRAWLSDHTSRPADVFSGNDKPYVLLSGVQLAASFTDLVQTGPAVGITITDTYQSVSAQRVWTHTTYTGHPIPGDHHCAQWTDDSFTASAQFGLNSAPADALQTWHDQRWWTHYDLLEMSCNFPLRLYCFET